MLMRLHFPHVLGVCSPSPIPPGRLVLSVTIRTVDVQHAKVRQDTVIPYLPRSTPWVWALDLTKHHDVRQSIV